MNEKTNETKLERKEKKLLSPKLDVVFQAIFGNEKNESITKGFLETILKKPIEKIDLSKNPILRREFQDEKLGILDILAEINENEKVNIELQLVDQDNIIERILYYWSRLYSRGIKKGEDYHKLYKTIVILITDFKIEKLSTLEYYTKWQIMESNNKIVLTENLEIYIMELPKIKGKEKNKDKLLDWLYFIANPKSERVVKNMGENKELKEAVEELNRISEDEKMQRIAELREKAILDEKAIYRKGLKDGKIDEKKEVASKMIKEGLSNDIIMKITGLSKEELEEL